MTERNQKERRKRWQLPVQRGRRSSSGGKRNHELHGSQRGPDAKNIGRQRRDHTRRKQEVYSQRSQFILIAQRCRSFPALSIVVSSPPSLYRTCANCQSVPQGTEKDLFSIGRAPLNLGIRPQAKHPPGASGQVFEGQYGMLTRRFSASGTAFLGAGAVFAFFGNNLIPAGSHSGHTGSGLLWKNLPRAACGLSLRSGGIHSGRLRRFQAWRMFPVKNRLKSRRLW